uniref:Uncharacterized protein n=1 Tax=Rhizophora mucronata TaxID=61149 RepID=A0A2P2MWC0_RHIMU
MAWVQALNSACLLQPSLGNQNTLREVLSHLGGVITTGISLLHYRT